MAAVATSEISKSSFSSVRLDSVLSLSGSRLSPAAMRLLSRTSVRRPSCRREHETHTPQGTGARSRSHTRSSRVLARAPRRVPAVQCTARYLPYEVGEIPAVLIHYIHQSSVPTSLTAFRALCTHFSRGSPHAAAQHHHTRKLRGKWPPRQNHVGIPTRESTW